MMCRPLHSGDILLCCNIRFSARLLLGGPQFSRQVNVTVCRVLCVRDEQRVGGQLAAVQGPQQAQGQGEGARPPAGLREDLQQQQDLALHRREGSIRTCANEASRAHSAPQLVWRSGGWPPLVYVCCSSVCRAVYHDSSMLRSDSFRVRLVCGFVSLGSSRNYAPLLIESLLFRATAVVRGRVREMFTWENNTSTNSEKHPGNAIASNNKQSHQPRKITEETCVHGMPYRSHRTPRRCARRSPSNTVPTTPYPGATCATRLRR